MTRTCTFIAFVLLPFSFPHEKAQIVVYYSVYFNAAT